MNKFPIPKQNIRIIIAGLAIMVLGYILMTGGGAKSPDEFSYEIFSTRRLTISPILILIGFAVEIFAIMHRPKQNK